MPDNRLSDRKKFGGPAAFITVKSDGAALLIKIGTLKN